jgi:hypothetical protein
VIGAIILIAVMVLVFPAAAVFGPGALVAALHGWFLTDDAEQRFEGSELTPLSRQ